MKFSTVNIRTLHECLGPSGKEYARFSSVNWGYWIGQSLELIENAVEIEELEAAFQASHAQNLQVAQLLHNQTPL